MNPLRVVEGGGNEPPEPDWSLRFADPGDQALAHERWRDVISALREAGTLAAANGHAVARLVWFYVTFEGAASDVMAQGRTLKAKRTGTPYLNPNWTVALQADDRASGHEAELGISPRRRGAVTPVKKRPRAGTAASRFLGEKQG